MTPSETTIWWDGLLIGQAIGMAVGTVLVVAMYLAHRRETRVLRQFKVRSLEIGRDVGSPHDPVISVKVGGAAPGSPVMDWFERKEGKWFKKEV